MRNNKPGRPAGDVSLNKSTQVSVRLDGLTTDRLDHINKYLGVGRAELIRRAIEDFIRGVEKDGNVTISTHVPKYRSET